MKGPEHCVFKRGDEYVCILWNELGSMWVCLVEVARDGRGVGYDALGIRVVDDGQGVQRGSVRPLLRRTGSDLLAQWLDVRVIDPDGFVWKTLDVQGVPTSMSDVVSEYVAGVRLLPGLPSVRGPSFVTWAIARNVIKDNSVVHGGREKKDCVSHMDIAEPLLNEMAAKPRSI